HDDALVPGPLQGAWLATELAALARERGGRLCRLSYRSVERAYAGETLVCAARVADVADEDGDLLVAVDVTVAAEDGRTTLEGTATLRIPVGEAPPEEG